MLARLDFELQERKRLSAELDHLREKNELMSKVNRGKEGRLRELPTMVHALLKAAQPVEEYLGSNADGLISPDSAANHLPTPLYVLYAHVSAYCEANGDVVVDVIGDVSAVKDTFVDLDNVDAEPEDVMDDDGGMDDANERVSRRGKARKSEQEVLKNRRAALLKLHPLRVKMSVTDGDYTITLEFAYLTELNTVSVFTTSTPDGLPPSLDLLGSLYPDDTGRMLPDPANIFKMDQLNMGAYHTYTHTVGRTYQWAQSISGLYPTNLVVTESMLRQKRVSLVQVLGDLKARIKSARALTNQIAALSKLSIPIAKEARGMFPTHPTSTFAKWVETTATVSVGDADSIRLPSRIFEATFRQDDAWLQSAIEVSPVYPLIPPKFAIQMSKQGVSGPEIDSNVRAIEAEVNLHYRELTAKYDPDNLLAHQVRRVQMCFDCVLQGERKAKKADGRATRGRERLRPFQYSEEMGVFVHRTGI